MSDSLAMTVQALLSSADVGTFAGDRITPIFVGQQVGYPNIVVHLIHELDPVLLCGPTHWPESRVSIELRTEGDAPALAQGARAVVMSLHGNTFYIAGYSATFLKEGTDVTDAAPSTNTQSEPTVIRRIIDFKLRWQAIPGSGSGSSG